MVKIALEVKLSTRDFCYVWSFFRRSSFLVEANVVQILHGIGDKVQLHQLHLLMEFIFMNHTLARTLFINQAEEGGCNAMQQRAAPRHTWITLRARSIVF